MSRQWWEKSKTRMQDWIPGFKVLVMVPVKELTMITVTMS
jgi:hypothetical protein